MYPTVDMIVTGLLSQNYIELGGSVVFRLLRNNKTNQVIKIFYNDYDNPTEIIIVESVEANEETT